MRLTFLRQACQGVPACRCWRSQCSVNESLGEGRPGAQGQPPGRFPNLRLTKP